MHGQASATMDFRSGLPIVWRLERELNGKVVADEATAWDGKVPIGYVWRQHDPLNLGAWRWSMFAGNDVVHAPEGLRRDGGAFSQQLAKAASERAYSKLLAAQPGQRRAIHDHCETVEQRARMWARGCLRRPENQLRESESASRCS